MADEETILETGEEAFDLIDSLIDALNDGVADVTFDRDVLDTDRPEDWGAVELTGQDDSEWADGHLIEQVLSADIWVCVSGRGSSVKRKVQAVLRQFFDTCDGGWRLQSRNYLYDLDKVMWRWAVTICGPLATEDTQDTQQEEDDGQDDGGRV